MVAEAGNGPNSGRLSLVDRATGTRRTLIDALPSGIHQAVQPSPSGPAGVALQGNAIYLVIGVGDSVKPGPSPGTEILNPSPSSPILSSLFELKPGKPLDAMTGPFTLQHAHHAMLDNGELVVLVSPSGEELTIRLIVNFPAATKDPRPEVPDTLWFRRSFAASQPGRSYRSLLHRSWNPN